MAFSWLKAPRSAFTFKNLWRHYARLWNFKLREGSFPAVVASLGCAGGPPPGPAWEDPSWLCVCIARQTMVLLSRNNPNPASVNTQIIYWYTQLGLQPLGTLQLGRKYEISYCPIIRNLQKIYLYKIYLHEILQIHITLLKEHRAHPHFPPWTH